MRFADGIAIRIWRCSRNWGFQWWGDVPRKLDRPDGWGPLALGGSCGDFLHHIYIYIHIYIYTYIFWLVVWKPGWVIWCYPLVNIQKTMENHNFNGKTHYKWSFSIAMVLNHAMDEELDIFWLLVWNMVFMTFHILGMSSSQVTSIFQRGRYTTNQYYLILFGLLQMG